MTMRIQLLYRDEGGSPQCSTMHVAGFQFLTSEEFKINLKHLMVTHTKRRVILMVPTGSNGYSGIRQALRMMRLKLWGFRASPLFATSGGSICWVVKL